MKKLLLLLFFSLPLVFVSAQQNIDINGRVTDMNDIGMPGVTVLVKGTMKGAITNFTGEYTINAPSDGVLVFSFIGFKTTELEVVQEQQVQVIN